MLATTTLEPGIPPAWNAVVMAIRCANAEGKASTPLMGFRPSIYCAGNALTTASIAPARSIETLGWTPAETLETYLRLRTFAVDWDAPGMEVYDDLSLAHYLARCMRGPEFLLGL